jgi:hypothetical protein
MMHELTRLRAEYLEMPGLQLTREQVQRLCGLERRMCTRVLDALVDTRFLYLKANGTYARLTDGAAAPRPQPATTTVEDDHRTLKAS